MLERFKYKRIIFKKKGVQGVFLNLILKKSHKSITEFAKSLNISVRSLRTWRLEKTRIPFEVAKELEKQYSIPLPEIAEIISLNDHLRNIAATGGVNNSKNNSSIGGDPMNRKVAWRKWWTSKGQYKKHPIINIRKQIFKPNKSEQLAEFFGIMLGDGGISKYQIKITLNRLTDEKYIFYVSTLIQKLFKINPSVLIYPDDPIRKSIANIQVSSRELVEYLTKNGLVIGHKLKQKVTVPGWILSNEKFCIACARGLVDTDGCIYTNSYFVNKKSIHIKKLPLRIDQSYFLSLYLIFGQNLDLLLLRLKELTSELIPKLVSKNICLKLALVIQNTWKDILFNLL